MFSLNPIKLGLAGGILWAACMLIMTVISIYTGYAAGFFQMMSSVYPGFTVSWTGSILGLIYGFIDGFVGLFLLGWLYNKL